MGDREIASGFIGQASIAVDATATYRSGGVPASLRSDPAIGTIRVAV
jgi:hypothetical protein